MGRILIALIAEWDVSQYRKRHAPVERAFPPLLLLAGLLSAGSVLAQYGAPPPPWERTPGQPIPDQHLASDWSIDELEKECSSPDGRDRECLQGIHIDLGRDPAVVVLRQKNGFAGTERTVYLAPEGERVRALLEKACSYRRWDLCGIFVSMLRSGKYFAKDESYAQLITQWACANHYAQACATLQNEHVPILAPEKSPILTKTGSEHGVDRIPPRIHPLDEYLTKEEAAKKGSP